jgi:hypothetical protein
MVENADATAFAAQLMQDRQAGVVSRSRTSGNHDCSSGGKAEVLGRHLGYSLSADSATRSRADSAIDLGDPCVGPGLRRDDVEWRQAQ